MSTNKSIIVILCAIVALIIIAVVYKHSNSKPKYVSFTKEQIVNEFNENKEKFESVIEYARTRDRERICVKKDFRRKSKNYGEIEYLYDDLEPIKEDVIYIIDELGYLGIDEITGGQFSSGASIKIIEFLKSASNGQHKGLTYVVHGSFPEDRQPEDYGMEWIGYKWYYFSKLLE